MDGICNVAGKRTALLKDIGGKDYSLATMILDEYGEREAYILSHRPSPLKLLASLPAEMSKADREFAISTALAQASRAPFASMQELAEFENSLHGIAWNLMRALRVHHPDEATLQGAMAVIQKAGEKRLPEIIRALSVTEEKDILKNSSSPAVEALPGAESPGPSSTDSSPSDSTGPKTSSAA